MSSLNYMDLCRLCLVKEQVSVPIFDGEGDVRQIFIKITTCLPVKVSKEDSLPKKICSNCVYRVENSFEFWNTTVSAEKQLLQWLGDSSNERKLSPSTVSSNADQETVMETEQLVLKEERLEHDQSESLKSTGRAAAGGATPALIEQVAGAGTGAVSEEEDEDESEDGEEAAGNDSEESAEEDVEEPANKEEVESEEEEEDEPYEELEPTTFVNVSLACDEAGPSGMQQQSEGSDPKQTQSRMKAELAVAATAATSSEEPSTSASAPSTSGFTVKVELPSQLHEGSSPHLNRKNCTNPKQKSLHHKKKKLESNIGEGSTAGNKFGASQKNSGMPSLIDKFWCKMCGEKFFRERQLQLHMGKVHKNVCEVCHKVFSRKHQLHYHRKVHFKDKNEICDICGYATYYKHLLEFHRKRHFGDYTFKCNQCSAGFFSNAEFEEHKVVHTGLRPHQCDVCGKTFSKRGYLSAHMRYHNDTMYVCDVCGKAITKKNSLMTHLRKHMGDKPHVCDYCGKGFCSSNYLKLHRRTHTGEKPHKCIHCGKSFSQRSTLTIHMRNHTGEKPFVCDVCSRAFVCGNQLNNHKKAHHRLFMGEIVS